MHSNQMMIGIGAIAIVLAMSACQKNDAQKKAVQNQPTVSTNQNYRQKISVMSPPVTMKLGQVATIEVTVTNTSTMDWPASGSSPVNLSYHWVDRSGMVVVHDGERTGLSKLLKVGESANIHATIKSPNQPGEYSLRMSMVQEGVAWFDENGAEALNIPVKVK
jgi:hypothetical protein